ncbi:acylphosphatase [Frigoriglobus tundricola]|uniref:acylphosphatase n=1 Tax=Frigoriglobus tundricola TaxID=2774151 RepID=A0A6M5YJ29_9BACT|nr:acylphosphatase [Frigoriglobus tundricola]QJW93340.1 Acylphosphate phosphohydrolase [Frigoriglobus tundricola]
MAKVVYYSGDVQGVGFRATTVWIARLHPDVHGWVRNLADGRVELLAHGVADAIEAFLADVRKQMAEHIATEDVMERDLGEPLNGFRIVS